MKIAKNITELIGNTPILRIKGEANIYAKLEYFNPLGSVKDRIALAMIEAGEKQGLLMPGGVIIEPTSGNTGIGLAYIAAVKGYKCILTMPETMSVERRKLLATLGAELVLTPGTQGMRGAIVKAEELVKETPGAYMPQQFNNLANPEIHRRTTAQEILRDLEGMQIDYFIAGIGTGGTITGVGEVLKQKFPNCQIIAVEPASSPVLSGGQPGPHKIQGIGAGFVPTVLNTCIYDEIMRVADDDAKNTCQQAASNQGLFVGFSSGAALWSAQEIAKRPAGKGKNIVVILPDTGERYLSMLD